MRAWESASGFWLEASLAAAMALLLIAALQLILKGREQWMAACLLSSLAYVMLSLGLEGRDEALFPNSLKWGLLATAIFSFIRFRWHRSANGD